MGRRDRSVLSLEDCLLETSLGWNDMVKPALTGGEEGHPGDIRPQGRIPDPLARGLSIRQRLLGPEGHVDADQFRARSCTVLSVFPELLLQGEGSFTPHLLLTPLTALSLPATSILDD